MAHSDKHGPRSHKTHNANVFLTRERLDDEEMAEWITAAYGDSDAFKAMDKQEAIKVFAAVVDQNSREIFGQHMSGRSIGGMSLLMAQMMLNVETAHGYRFDSKTMPAELKDGLLLTAALERLAHGQRLNSVAANALSNGGKIMNALSDYAREVALVLPVTTKDQNVRDKIRTTSHGMPAVDIKFSAIAREYETHLLGSAAPGNRSGGGRAA
jgi:hypothetical protein